MVTFIVDILIVTFGGIVVIGSFFVGVTLNRIGVGLVKLIVDAIGEPVAIRIDDELPRMASTRWFHVRWRAALITFLVEVLRMGPIQGRQTGDNRNDSQYRDDTDKKNDALFKS